MSISYPRMISNVLFTPTGRKTSEWIMVVAQAPQRFEIFCCCPKWGPGCSHADAVMSRMKPWYRARTHLSDHKGGG